LDQVPRHELAVTSPAGATQAEVRFFAPEGAMIVDRVSLAGSANSATSTWLPSVPTISIVPSARGVTITNGGPIPSAATQLIASPEGQSFELRFSARMTSGTEGGAVELAFADDTGAPVGDVVRLGIDLLELDERAASGQMLAGATDVELRIVMPPDGSVEVTELSLTVGAAAEVGLHFVSEAPGELTMTNVAVHLDVAAPTVAPLPMSGCAHRRRPRPARTRTSTTADPAARCSRSSGRSL
jgi:hypothetical protein